MPIPPPKKFERMKKYISRCIAFVKGEKPETPNKQAAAICYTTWRRKKK